MYMFGQLATLIQDVFVDGIDPRLELFDYIKSGIDGHTYTVDAKAGDILEMTTKDGDPIGEFFLFNDDNCALTAREKKDNHAMLVDRHCRLIMSGPKLGIKDIAWTIAENWTPELALKFVGLYYGNPIYARAFKLLKTNQKALLALLDPDPIPKSKFELGEQTTALARKVSAAVKASLPGDDDRDRKRRARLCAWASLDTSRWRDTASKAKFAKLWPLISDDPFPG